VGYWEDIHEIARNFKVRKKFTPRMPAKQRESLYRKWKKAVERARGWEEE
jgi:glycerol kinase